MSAHATSSFVLALTLVFSLSGREAAGDAKPVGPADAAKAKQAVAAAEQTLSQLKGAAGAVPASRVIQAEADLAEAQVRLAAAEGKQQALLDGLSVLVALRERQWEQLKQATGAVPQRRVNNARIELAEARIRLELHTIVVLREQELAGLAETSAAVPKRQIDEARKALKEARTRLLTGEAALAADPGDPGRGAGEAEKKLQERLVVLEEIARLELEAFKGGQATFASVLSARREFVQAKLELTKDPAKRIEVLDDHVRIAKEIEGAVQRLVEGKHARGVDLLKAKAARLKAEADLAEGQSRAKPPKK